MIKQCGMKEEEPRDGLRVKVSPVFVILVFGTNYVEPSLLHRLIIANLWASYLRIFDLQDAVQRSYWFSR